MRNDRLAEYSTILEIDKEKWEKCWGDIPLFEYELFYRLENTIQFKNSFHYIYLKENPDVIFPFFYGNNSIRIKRRLGNLLFKLAPKTLIFGHPLLSSIEYLNINEFNKVVDYILEDTEFQAVISLNYLQKEEIPINSHLIKISASNNATMDIENVNSLKKYIRSQPQKVRGHLYKRFHKTERVKIVFSNSMESINEASIFFEITERRSNVSLSHPTVEIINSLIESIEKTTCILFYIDSVCIGSALACISQNICYLKRMGINYCKAGTNNILVIATKAGIEFAISNHCKTLNLGRGNKTKDRVYPRYNRTFHLIYLNNRFFKILAKLLTRFTNV